MCGARPVRDLLDSLYRGYPSGAILLWETDEKVPLQDFAVQQEDNPYANTRLLLDGQQRLTSLSAVIRGEQVKVRGRKRPIELLFNLEHPEDVSIVTEVNENSDEDEDVTEDETEANEDELQNRLDKLTFVVSTRKLEQLPHWVKVSEVFRNDEDAPFLARAGIEKINDPRYTKYSQRLAQLRGIRRYSYRMDVLERTMSYDEVTEIFVRVNSLGAKLRSSDLALAQITAKWRGALEVFQEFQLECADFGFDLDLGIHLKNMIAFATGQSRFLTVGGLPIDRLQSAWTECCRGMEFATNYLRRNVGIDSPSLLSSPFLLIAVAYYGHKRDFQIRPEESEDLRRWVLVANVKGRYSRGSSESLLDQDLATLRDGGSVDALIDRLRSQVGRLDVTADELVGRNQRSALFKTMFLAFRQDGARDWHSDLAIALDHSGAQHKLQFHHVFPKALLTKLGRTPREADDIANLAFIGGRTNRKISDKNPSEYIPKLQETIGDAPFIVQCIPLESDLLGADHYTEFLVRRRELVAERINSFLDSEGIGQTDIELDPRRRELDQRVERIELRLRSLINRILGGDEQLVPPHIATKVAERISAAVRKNPAVPNRDVESLAGRLQYFDLRELQDLIVSAALWPKFESTFGSKQVLETRCGQMAELRNVVRHTRTLDEVTRKDGEAALTWFAQVLISTPMPE